MKQERVHYLDYLRVFAVIAVIVLHVAAENMGTFYYKSFDWNVCNFYDSVVRWGVPVFVMISGSLFLARNIDIKTIYKKNISRLAVAYFVWSVLYAIVTPVAKFIVTQNNEFTINSIITNIISGSYHMWFIPMMIGIYMCIPILKQIINKNDVMIYYLIISFVFACFIPEFINLLTDFGGETTSVLIKSVNGVISDMNMHIFLGYAFYFVLGYWLSNVEFTKKQRVIVYLLGLLGFASTIILTVCATWNSGAPRGTYYNNLSVNVLFEAVAVFTWFKYRQYNSTKFNNIMSLLSKYSFGAYLVHVFFLLVFKTFGLHSATFFTVASIPVISLICVVFSFACSWFIHKIPVLNKWIV